MIRLSGSGARAAGHRPLRTGAPRPWILLLVCTFAAGCLDITQPRFGELRVRVVDHEGAPVPLAQVEPHGGWYWWHRRAVGHTDDDGYVRFRLPPTTYRVFAHPPVGYEHADPPYWATMTEVPVPTEGASVVLEFRRVPDPATAPFTNTEHDQRTADQ